MIKLLICDDDMLIRESLKIILGMDEEIEVVGTCENGSVASKFIVENKVDVALLDVRMPVMNGVEATKNIVNKSETKVIILTTFDEDDFIKDAIRYGAKGYILKNTPPDKIIDTIKMVHKGHSVIQDVVLEKLKNNMDDSCEKINKDNFTEREIEIIESIAEGLSNKEISSKLFISEGTVKNYISNILNKTGLSHRTQIAISYIKGNFK
ncbi:two component transcriptional regulator, LuxR family [Clostridium cavendishii DSM 21758]|uniref:Stage 0 sporulation protein A homolog n=1 Tax=Clostridium cavendishii DSM 21758 TaxID=1121302 RepID=A0A1M6LS10_9CLOT|nr:response regulator transcription factor [Clostridium cavendishii]SHJ73967.1 two component transcriptional regulator, LuxR family [Clostridium cavendishii DSM 21758]